MTTYKRPIKWLLLWTARSRYFCIHLPKRLSLSESCYHFIMLTNNPLLHLSHNRGKVATTRIARVEVFLNRKPTSLDAPFDAKFDSALNPSRIRLNPSGIANPDTKYPLDGSKKQVFRGYRVLFGRWAPGPRAPFDAEFNSALNPSRIRLNPSGIANPDTKYPLDGSKKLVFRGYRVLFGRWPPGPRAPFDAEFNSALNPSRIRLNPSGIANPERKCRIWC